MQSFKSKLKKLQPLQQGQELEKGFVNQEEDFVMKNLEGIRLAGFKESELEKRSIVENDYDNFDDCALTEKERLERLKEALINLSNSQKNNQDNDDVDDYEDCRKKSR